MMSSPPKASSVDLISCAGKSGLVTSPATTMAMPPASRMAAAVSSAGAASRSLTTTFAPSEANSFAAAAPMPRPEPVKIATLLSSMPIGISPVSSFRVLAACGQRGHEGAGGLHVAVLVCRLKLARDALLAVGLVLLGDGAGAGNHVVEVRHALEAHAELAQGRRADVIPQKLAQEAHNQHAVRDDAARADHFADLRVGVQRVEIAGRARVAHQLQVCDAGLDQLRNLIADLHVFKIPGLHVLRVGCHDLISFVARLIHSRTITTWRAFRTGWPCWLV